MRGASHGLLSLRSSAISLRRYLKRSTLSSSLESDREIIRAQRRRHAWWLAFNPLPVSCFSFLLLVSSLVASLCVPCCTPLSLVPSFSLSPQVSRIPLSLSLSSSLILYAGLNGIVMRRRLQFPPPRPSSPSPLSPPSPPTPLRILLLVLPEFVFLYLSPSPTPLPPLLLARSQPSFSISVRP